jgi:hypothetical protein
MNCIFFFQKYRTIFLPINLTYIWYYPETIYHYSTHSFLQNNYSNAVLIMDNAHCIRVLACIKIAIVVHSILYYLELG